MLRLVQLASNDSCIIMLFGGAALWAVTMAAAAPAPKRPNIVFLIDESTDGRTYRLDFEVRRGLYS